MSKFVIYAELNIDKKKQKNIGSFSLMVALKPSEEDVLNKDKVEQQRKMAYHYIWYNKTMILLKCLIWASSDGYRTSMGHSGP